MLIIWANTTDTRCICADCKIHRSNQKYRRLSLAKQAHRERIRDEATWRGAQNCTQLNTQRSQETARSKTSETEALYRKLCAASAATPPAPGPHGAAHCGGSLGRIYRGVQDVIAPSALHGCAVDATIRSFNGPPEPSQPPKDRLLGLAAALFLFEK